MLKTKNKSPKNKKINQKTKSKTKNKKTQPQENIPWLLLNMQKYLKKSIKQKCETQDLSNPESGRYCLIVTNRLHKICRNCCVVIFKCVSVQRL